MVQRIPYCFHPNIKKGNQSPDYNDSIERLKTGLRRTEQEHDILKKALGIFSRGIWLLCMLLLIQSEKSILFNKYAKY